ncbi:MAG: hypothetical protein HW395_1291 [candidate division NC10 bacterium]|nr:hypothetical protein [candidate division NC10 bacterium]
MGEVGFAAGQSHIIELACLHLHAGTYRLSDATREPVAGTIAE